MPGDLLRVPLPVLVVNHREGYRTFFSIGQRQVTTDGAIGHFVEAVSPGPLLVLRRVHVGPMGNGPVHTDVPTLRRRDGDPDSQLPAVGVHAHRRDGPVRQGRSLGNGMLQLLHLLPQAGSFLRLLLQRRRQRRNLRVQCVKLLALPEDCRQQDHAQRQRRPIQPLLHSRILSYRPIWRSTSTAATTNTPRTKAI